MTDNTDFKIVDHLAVYPASQYNFTFPQGWTPVNENLTASLRLERDQYPYVGLAQIIDFGIAERPIVLQGRDLTSGTLDTLSAAMLNPRIKKLYLGGTYYYYVRGLEPRLIRDASAPLIRSYTAAFLAVDPFMYDDTIVSGTFSTSTFTVPATSTLGGSTYVEPIFWISGTTTAGTLTDSRGCRLSFTPPTTDTWIIMPYYNPNVAGFTPDYPAAYKLQNVGSRTVANFWALDGKVEGASNAVDFVNSTANKVTIPDLALDETNTNKLYGAAYRYPRAEYGAASVITKTGFTSGTVGLQWKLRKL